MVNKFMFVLFPSLLKLIHCEIDCTNPPRDEDPEHCCKLMPLYFEDVEFFECSYQNDDFQFEYRDWSTNDCITECMFRRADLFVGNTKVMNKTAMNWKFKNQIYYSDYWYPIIDNGLDICYDKIGNTTNGGPILFPTNATLSLNGTKFRGGKPFIQTVGNSTCSSQPTDIVLCVAQYVFQHCPEKHWITSDVCSYMKNFTDFCNFLPDD